MYITVVAFGALVQGPQPPAADPIAAHKYHTPLNNIQRMTTHVNKKKFHMLQSKDHFLTGSVKFSPQGQSVSK